MLQDSLHATTDLLQDAAANNTTANGDVGFKAASPATYGKLSSSAAAATDSIAAAPLPSYSEILDAIFGRAHSGNADAADSTAAATMPESFLDQSAIDSTTHTNWFEFLASKFDFQKFNPITSFKTHVTQPGISGDPVPYKLSNDVLVTTTLLISLFIACFVVTRSMHALFVQIKNFFFNRDRNESFSLKSEGELKNHVFVVVLESFVLSLLFFSYSEYKISGQFVETSPYLLLFVDMGLCIIYFILKYLFYSLFNWAFFKREDRELWTTSYNLVMLAKAIFLLPLVLVVLYFDLPPQLCIWGFIILIGIFELLILYKTRQIFFNSLSGILTTFLYFCTLELLPLLALVGILIKTNEYLII